MSQFMFSNNNNNKAPPPQAAYGQPSSSAYYTQPGISGPPNLQFYSTPGDDAGAGGFYASRPSLEGNMASASGGAGVGGVGQAFGGSIQSGPTGWLAAFSSVGYDGEPPLLEGESPRLREKATSGFCYLVTLLTVLCVSLLTFVGLATRAGLQLLAHLPQVHDRPQPTPTDR